MMSERCSLCEIYLLYPTNGICSQCHAIVCRERDEARTVARLIADSFVLGDWQALLSTQQQNPWLCEEEKS